MTGSILIAFFGSAIRLALTLIVILLAPSAHADQKLVANEQGTVFVFADSGFMAGRLHNANFGTGVVDFRSGKSGRNNVNLYEAYLEPGIRGDINLSRYGTIYGEVSVVAALSEGQGDAGGFTRGNERDIDLETLHIGWRSGGLFPALGDDAIDISIGPQLFQVGDQFLFGDGNAEAFDDAVYYLGPRDAFKNAAVIRLKSGKLNGDAFYLRADKEHDSTRQVGVNASYDFDWGTFGGTYFHVHDATAVYTTRKGMDVTDARFRSKEPFGLTNFEISGEYVRQSGGDDGIKLDASGWHLTTKYTADRYSWSPYVRYRYSQFSGNDPDTAAREGYDSLYYGYTQYGDWFQGNVAGNYFLFNGNQRTHMVQVGATPFPWLQLDAFYYRFDLDEKFYNSTRTTDRHFGDEFNLVAQVFPSENTWVGVSYGYLRPGNAAKQAVGGRDAIHALEVFFIVNY